jgi:hypothetical protein
MRAQLAAEFLENMLACRVRVLRSTPQAVWRQWGEGRKMELGGI